MSELAGERVVKCCPDHAAARNRVERRAADKTCGCRRRCDLCFSKWGVGSS